jgi:hypothetical protein
VVLQDIRSNGEINFFGLAPSTMISCLSFTVFPLVSFCWIQNYTGKCREVKLYQTVKLKILYFNVIKPLFAKGSLYWGMLVANFILDRLFNFNQACAHDEIAVLSADDPSGHRKRSHN